MDSKKSFTEKSLFSLLLFLILLYISSLLYTVTNIIETGKNSSPVDFENLKSAAGVTSGIVVKPTDLLAAAGVLATLYVATALASRVQLSPEDEKKRDFIENGVSNLASVLCLYSLVCMPLYFFQGDREQLSFGEFIFYLIPAFICHYISAHPPINISDLQQRREENKEKIVKLESLNQKLNKKGHLIRYTSFYLSQILLRDKEAPKVKTYFQFVKTKWLKHLFLLILTFPSLTITSPLRIAIAPMGGESLSEILKEFPWEVSLFTLPFYALQWFCLYLMYDYATDKTKLEILNQKKGTPIWILIFQILISVPTVWVLLEMLTEGNFDKYSLLEKFAYSILLATQIAFLISYIILWRIYKNYRKYLQEGMMGDSFKSAVLHQALEKAKKEGDFLDQKIKDLQVPRDSFPSPAAQ
ncbi:hypothetical protein [Rothia sp. 32237D007AR]